MSIRSGTEILRPDAMRSDAMRLAAGSAAAATLAGIGEATPEFRRWNRRLYNPLCVTLAILVALGRRGRS